jgi:hypothetical protein
MFELRPGELWFLCGHCCRVDVIELYGHYQQLPLSSLVAMCAVRFGTSPCGALCWRCHAWWRRGASREQMDCYLAAVVLERPRNVVLKRERWNASVGGAFQLLTRAEKVKESVRWKRLDMQRLRRARGALPLESHWRGKERLTEGQKRQRSRQQARKRKARDPEKWRAYQREWMRRRRAA